MIKKYYELNKLKLSEFNLYLLHGKNEGLKYNLTETLTKNFKGQINKYEENEFIDNFYNILSQINNKSLFNDETIIIILRATDRVNKYISEILKGEINDTKIIINSAILDKKSKLRSLFEKDSNLIAIPVYEDDYRNLSKIIIEYLNNRKIKLSREAINLIVNRASGDRKNLQNELDKIYNFSFSKKNINYYQVLKLTNLAENYGVNELVDNYLSKDKKNIAKILNENNYSDDDCILILRTIMSKSKRLLNIIEMYKENKNIDEVISATKPPIFWKDKNNVKKQVTSWEIDELRKMIYKINEIEILVKVNSKNSLNIVSDFMINNQ
tara:strand:- start:3933 stop:4910 length:978 start_codon:yes stop_codon:yes gene_type:complete